HRIHPAGGLEARSAENRVDVAGLAAGELDRKADRHRIGGGEDRGRLEVAGLPVGAAVEAVPRRTEAIGTVGAAVAAVKARDPDLVDAEDGGRAVEAHVVLGVGALRAVVLRRGAVAALLEVGPVPGPGNDARGVAVGVARERVLGLRERGRRGKRGAGEYEG